MDKIKKQALEAAGWKFGDAEDFLNEGQTMNVDEAMVYASRDKCFWAGEVHTALETLAKEVERLRAELAASKAASVPTDEESRQAFDEHLKIMDIPTSRFEWVQQLDYVDYEARKRWNSWQAAINWIREKGVRRECR